MIIKSPNINFSIKKETEDKENKIINPDNPPITEDNNNLTFDIFLFKTIEIPSNNIKSNKKLTKKT